MNKVLTLLFCIYINFSFAQISIEKPKNLVAKTIAPDMATITFEWNSPTVNFAEYRYVVFNVRARNILTNQISIIKIREYNLNKFNKSISITAFGLVPDTKYVFYFDINISSAVNVYETEFSSPMSDVTNEITTDTRKHGITVITHGYQLLGLSSDAFIKHAQKIKKRIENNSTIYANVGRGSSMHWKKIEGDGNGELIFVYDWAEYSDDPAGNLEAASDRLFSLLINPIDENGTMIKSNTIAELISKNHVHFIGHSRGTILLLQTIHRFLEHFPKIKIHHYTALDPHPASKFGDISSEIQSLPNLPSVFGNAKECSTVFKTCLNGENISIGIPENVLYADCYYRKDGEFEDIFTDFTAAPFDGVPILENKSFSWPLNNKILARGLSGGAHSNVHIWYFNTVDLLDSISFSKFVPLFPDNHNRANAGFYFSNLGGGLNKLPFNDSRVSIETLRNQINTRQGGRPLDIIFNGYFNYELTSWEYYPSNLPFSIDNRGLSIGGFTKTGFSLNHDSFFIPKGRGYLNFDIIPTTLSPNSTISLIWYANGKLIKSIGPQCIRTEQIKQKYYVEIPKELIGQVATFKLIFTKADKGLNPYLGDFYLNNFDLSIDRPTSGLDIGKGYCCDDINNINFKITVAGAKFKHDINNKLLSICSPVTLNTEGCQGIVVWNDKDTLTSINIDPVLNIFKSIKAKCVLGEECVKLEELVIRNINPSESLAPNAGSDRNFCSSTRSFNLDAEPPKYGLGKWSSSYIDYNMVQISNINDPKATVTMLFEQSTYGGVFIWETQDVCSNNILKDDVEIKFSLPPTPPGTITQVAPYTITSASVNLQMSPGGYVGEILGMDGVSEGDKRDYSAHFGYLSIWVYKEGTYTFKNVSINPPCPSAYTTFKVIATCPPCSNLNYPTSWQCQEKCKSNLNANKNDN